MKVYIASAPHQSGIYETWAECKRAIAGVRGARYQAVANREKAEAMLYGQGIVLRPGNYVFTDGNSAGGVGVVFIEQGLTDVRSVQTLSTSVFEAFRAAGVPLLKSATAVSKALREQRNVLSEMAALYHALRRSKPQGRFTVVHDYVGVAGFMGTPWWRGPLWKSDGGPVIASVVKQCRELIVERGLDPMFVHQPGHQSWWIGRDDFARWNALADGLAREGAARLAE
jgi:ribonuclease HI